MERCLNLQSECYSDLRVQAAMVTDFDEIIIYSTFSK